MDVNYNKECYSNSLRTYTDTHRVEESIWHDPMWKLNCAYRLTCQRDLVCPNLVYPYVSCPDLPRPSLLTQTDLANADLSLAVLCLLDYNTMTRPYLCFGA